MANILIIEDNKDDLAKLTAALEALGHTVTGHTHGGRGLSCAIKAETAFELILTDGQLPGERGPTIIKTLRKQGYPSTPIIASSGDSSLWDDFNGDTNVHPLDKTYGPGPSFASIWNVKAAAALAQKLLT